MKRFFTLVSALACVALSMIPGRAADLYVSCFGDGKIKIIDTETLKVKDFGAAVQPFGLAFDGGGNLLVASAGEGKILKFSPNGQKTILASGFGYPVGVAVRGGDTYVTDYRPDPDDPTGRADIWKISPDGSKALFSKNTDTRYIIGAADIAIDSSGNLLTSNYAQGSGAAVYSVSPDASFSSLLNYRGFKSPYGLAMLDKDLIIGDYGTGTISRRAPGSAPQIWGTGPRGLMGVAVGPSGEIWAANMDRGSVVRVGARLGDSPGAIIDIATGFKKPVGLAFKP